MEEIAAIYLFLPIFLGVFADQMDLGNEVQKILSWTSVVSHHNFDSKYLLENNSINPMSL